MAEIYVHKKFLDKEFQNWLKAALCINILKQVLEDFLCREIQQFHQDAIQSILTAEEIQNGLFCTQCSIENVLHCPTRNMCVIKTGSCSFHASPDKFYRACPKNICEKIRDQIRDRHKFNFPSWKNTSPQRWCMEPWELAKCYMPPGAYANVKSAEDTDFNGLLSVIINNTAFKNTVDDRHCTETREMGNIVRHSANLTLSDTELNDILATFIKFLKSFSNNPKTQEAVLKVQKIHSDSLPIDTTQVRDVLTSSMTDCTDTTLENADFARIKVLQQMKDLLEEYQNMEDDCGENIRAAEMSTLNEILLAVGKRLPHKEERTYQQLRESFREELIIFNKAQHSNVPITPFTDEYDFPLVNFYVKPNMYQVHTYSALSEGSTKGLKPVNNLHDVIFTNGKRCNEIYVTSDAGLGKTMYGKWLAVLWCKLNQAVVEDSGPKSTEESTLLIFDFVFLVSLRNSHQTECDVDQMIYRQIVSQLPWSSSYSFNFLQQLLNNENTLIVLDGLDEWSHPDQEETKCQLELVSIPHRKPRANCTILTTSRPWKFDLVRLKQSQVEKHIEIGALSTCSRDHLIHNVMEILHDDDSLEDFKRELEDKKLSELASIPLVLMHMICLWCDNRQIGKYRYDIYCRIVAFKIARAENRYGSSLEVFAAAGNDSLEADLMSHVALKEFGRQYHGIMIAIAKLAFFTLFGVNRESCLVFDYGLACKHLCEKYYKASLQIGLLTQSKGISKLTKRNSNVSFPHKTFQEFFAALYLSTLTEKSEEIFAVKRVCCSIDKILEMSNVFIFLSSPGSNILNLLSQHFIEIIQRDPKFTEFRRNSCLLTYWDDLKPVRHFQDMLIDCSKEFIESGLEKTHALHILLEDLFIDKISYSEANKYALRCLIKAGGHRLKSLHVTNIKSSEDMNDIVEYYSLNEIKGLKKLDLWISASEEDIVSIMSASVDTLKHLMIHTGYWNQDRWVEHYVPVTDKWLDTMNNVAMLETLSLWDIVLAHEQLKTLLDYINNKKDIKQLGLGNVKCSDHSLLCTGLTLDLSGHSFLDNLQVNLIPVSEIKASVNALKECHVGAFPTAGVLQTFLESILDAHKLHTFGCFSLQAEEDFELLLSTIPHLESLQCFLLNRVNLGNKSLRLSRTMNKFRLIKLKRIKLTSTVFEALARDVIQLPNPVRVELVGCEIYPTEEFELHKQMISESVLYRVIEDSVDQWKRNAFVFETAPSSSEAS